MAIANTPTRQKQEGENGALVLMMLPSTAAAIRQRTKSALCLKPQYQVQRRYGAMLSRVS